MNGYLTDPVLLDKLARNASELLRLEAALNRYSGPETLIELIDDDCDAIRAAVFDRLLEPRLLTSLSSELRERLISRLVGLRRGEVELPAVA